MKNLKMYFGNYESIFNTVKDMCNLSDRCYMKGDTSCPIDDVLGICQGYGGDFDAWAKEEAAVRHVMPPAQCANNDDDEYEVVF